jgi:hypothetical protein
LMIPPSNQSGHSLRRVKQPERLNSSRAQKVDSVNKRQASHTAKLS